MTKKLDLAAIKERAEGIIEHTGDSAYDMTGHSLVLAGEDIPELVAEVEKLQALIQQYIDGLITESEMYQAALAREGE